MLALCVELVYIITGLVIAGKGESDENTTAANVSHGHKEVQMTDAQEKSYNLRLEAARKNFEDILENLPRKQRDKIYGMIASSHRVAKEYRRKSRRSDFHTPRVGRG